MDALHPRLLPARFAETFRFYEAVLPQLIGANLVKGSAEDSYAHWDVDGQGALTMLARGAMAATLGTADLPAPTGRTQDATMMIFRVDDVTKGLILCLANGGALVAEATNRPEWGPTLRTAHLRDPDGNLIELQSY